MSIRAIQGDCLEKMKDLSANSIDLFICDLPYGCLSHKRGGKRVGECPPDNPNGNIVIVNKPCDWDIPIDLEKFWEQVKRLSKNKHTPVIHFCSAKFGYDLIKSNEKWFRYDLVWEKTNAVGFLSANKMPMRSHENIYVFSKAGAYYNRVDISGDFVKAGGGRSAGQQVYGSSYETIQPDNEGKRCVKSVITIPNRKTKGGHPTQKPEEIYKWLIERYCPAGGTILDPTAGSFTSCKVAKSLGRHAIGIEMNPGFYSKFHQS